MRSPFTKLRVVRQYKVIHESGRLRVLVVICTDARPEEVERRVCRALSGALREVGAEVPVIAVEAVEVIPREEGHGAKLKLVEISGGSSAASDARPS